GQRRQQRDLVELEQYQARRRGEVAATQARAHRRGEVAGADRIGDTVDVQAAARGTGELRIELQERAAVATLDRLRDLFGGELFLELVFVEQAQFVRHLAGLGVVRDDWL